MQNGGPVAYDLGWRAGARIAIAGIVPSDTVSFTKARP
jgi:hypothetical protein